MFGHKMNITNIGNLAGIVFFWHSIDVYQNLWL